MPDGPLLPANELHEAAQSLMARAEAEEARLKVRQALDVEVGVALQQRRHNSGDSASFIADLVRDWDPNRDGVCVRTPSQADRLSSCLCAGRRVARAPLLAHRRRVYCVTSSRLACARDSGEISKMEFRQNVRKLLPHIKIDSGEIDALARRCP